jgi:hypothetical protein
MEPISSFRQKNEAIIRPVATETGLESPASLPTIESLSELENTMGLPVSRTTSKAQQTRRPRTLTRVRSETKFVAPAIKPDTTIKPDPSSSPSRSLSRRSSSPSVKGIFSPFLFEFGARVSRCSPTQRQQIEQGLVDVFSDLCRDARSVAEIHRVELFQLPKKPHHVLPTPSGIGSIRDHTLVSRRSYAGTASAFAGERLPRKQKTLSDISCGKAWPTGSSSDYGGSPWTVGIATPIPGIVPDYSPDSVSSSGGTSGGGSSVSSPITSSCPFISSFPPATGLAPSHVKPVSIAKSESRPKRSQSMVDNFRSFFSVRATLSTRRGYHALPTYFDSSQGGRDAPNNTRAQSSPNQTRKRTQSSPVVPLEQSFSSAEPTASGSSPCLQEGLISPAGNPVLDQQHPQEEFLQEGPKTLHRKRPSFLKSYTHRSPTKSADDAIGPTRRRSLRDILHYFRSNSFTSVTA